MDWMQAATWAMLGGIATAWVITAVYFRREDRRLRRLQSEQS
jgi:uncharacterized membrane protein (DUF485 family)